MPEVEVKEGEAAAPAVDANKVLLAIQETQKAFGAQLAALTQKIQAQPAVEVKQPVQKRISEIALEDEEKAYAEIENRAAARAELAIQSKLESQNRQSQVLTDLREQWPELNQDDSPISVETLKIFNGLPKTERTPAALEMAAMKAAKRLGLKSQAEREVPEEDDFVVGSKNTQRGTKQGKGKKDGMDERTSTFATLLGRDPEKVRAFADRQTWSRYRAKGAK